MQEDDVMELTWHNGQIVVHRPPRPPLPSHPPPLYIHEEEMATWLPQPIDDVPLFHQDFTSDLLYPPASCTETVVTDSTPESRHHPPLNPEPPMIRTESDFRAHRFGHFSSFMPAGYSIKESASVVESNTTPLARESEVGVGRSGGFVAGSSSVGVDGRVETMSFDLEPLASGDVQKRKDREAEEAELPSQEFDDKAADTNKQARAPTAKRTRAAEVHNLSERKRRDRINEKMKALQELIPRCNKSDKASMLDDAFEYLKSLQMQVQMMSMGCGVMPMTMMFPGLQQYMQPMGMGMRLGIDMNRPMMPFPLATPNHLSPRFSVPSYLPSSSFMPLDASFIQVSNPASTLTPARIQNANQPQVQTTPDQYLYQPTQMQPSQIYPENPENPLPG